MSSRSWEGKGAQKLGLSYAEMEKQAAERELVALLPCC